MITQIFCKILISKKDIDIKKKQKKNKYLYNQKPTRRIKTLSNINILS